MVIFYGIKPEVSEKELEYLVGRVFFKSIDLLGGLNRLAEYRTLTWLPSLARSCFAVVLREEYLKSENEIAEKVGLTRNTVRNILRADPNNALYKIQHMDDLSEDEKKYLKVHTAGGIAKLAYRLVKEGQEAQTLLEFCRELAETTVQVVGESPWAYTVLKRTKGLTYPLTGPEVLEERLGDLSILGVSGRELVQTLHYPIKNPAQLLREVKEALKIRRNS